MKFLLAAMILLGASPLLGAERAEFVGYLSDANGRLFILYDGAAKESSLWMKLGQSWHGLTPIAFDAKEELLTVRDGGAEKRFSLRDPKVAGLGSIVLAGKGMVTSADGTVSYGPDTKLWLRNSVITSPTGIMVTDRDQKIVAGDLVIERPDGMTFRITNGVVRMNGNTTMMSGDSVVGTKGPAPAGAAPIAPEPPHP
jgi:hypothetical protein